VEPQPYVENYLETEVFASQIQLPSSMTLVKQDWKRNLGERNSWVSRALRASLLCLSSSVRVGQFGFDLFVKVCVRFGHLNQPLTKA